jgi:enoyl-CoA hydratase
MHEFFNWDFEITDELAILKITNPTKMNAFSKKMIEELDIILSRISKNPDLRILLLTTSSEKFFSAGADIDWFMTLDGPEAERISQKSHTIFGKLEELPIPVIAIVKGLCLTAGLELILCSDLIFAADNARFGQTEVK